MPEEDRKGYEELLAERMGAASGQDRLATLAARVTELEHDLAALAEQLGWILGEPFRSTAREITTKRQT